MNNISFRSSFMQVFKSLEEQQPFELFLNNFLDTIICSVSRNPLTKDILNKEQYSAALSKFPPSIVKNWLPKLFGYLFVEMNSRIKNGKDPDILGEIFKEFGNTSGNLEFIFSKKNTFQNDIAYWENFHEYGEKMLVICTNDIQAKITSVNLFISGPFNAEIRCMANDGHFKFGYLVTSNPPGIFHST